MFINNHFNYPYITIKRISDYNNPVYLIYPPLENGSTYYTIGLLLIATPRYSSYKFSQDLQFAAKYSSGQYLLIYIYPLHYYVPFIIFSNPFSKQQVVF